jgi:hypothetical protein
MTAELPMREVSRLSSAIIGIGCVTAECRRAFQGTLHAIPKSIFYILVETARALKPILKADRRARIPVLTLGFRIHYPARAA